MIYDGIEEVRPQEPPEMSAYAGLPPARLREMAEQAVDLTDALDMEFYAQDAELQRTVGTHEELLHVTPVYQQSGDIYEEIEREDAQFTALEEAAKDLKSHSDEQAERKKIRRGRYAKAVKLSAKFEELASKSHVGPAIKPSAETVQLCAMDEFARKNFHPDEYASYIRNMRRLYSSWAAAFQEPSLNRQLAHPSPHLKGYEKLIRAAMNDVPVMNPYQAQEHVEEHITAARRMIRNRLRRLVAGSRQGRE